ncbi:MAG: VWA domain-containing protein [Planctomycetota bacterium]
MRFRYTDYDPAKESLKDLLKRLKDLYQQLLLQADGDPEQALAWMEQLAQRYRLLPPGFTMEDFKQALQRERLVEATPEGLKMSAAGARALRQDSLERIFSGLDKDTAGDHRVAAAGAGQERLPETRAWSFGDPVDLIDAAASVRNALKRGLPGESGPGLTLSEDDLEVFETEHLSGCATVLLIDLSHSMILYGEDRITPAKRVALALVELIKTKFPKDRLRVVCFGDEAWEVPLEDIPRISVGPFHTNTRAGLQLARDLLRRERRANRQIFMLTDGKPSALTEHDGEVYKNPFGLDRRVVAKTIEEAVVCRRHGIPITTFMLTEDPVLVGFVEEFTEANKGRAYFAGGEQLGATVFVDYLKNRRSRAR